MPNDSSDKKMGASESVFHTEQTSDYKKNIQEPLGSPLKSKSEITSESVRLSILEKSISEQEPTTLSSEVISSITVNVEISPPKSKRNSPTRTLNISKSVMYVTYPNPYNKFFGIVPVHFEHE